MKVAAVLLAAGEGRRFRGPKQLAIWRGKPLILHVLDALFPSRVCCIQVVLGAHAERVGAVVETWARARKDTPPAVATVYNPRWREGLSTSVRAGLRALEPVDAALFPLADQPGVTTDLFDALIAAYEQTRSPIVAPRYQGTPGAPVLFDAHLFPELMALQGDVGGRALIRRYPSRVHWVDWPHRLAGWDVDTPEDLLLHGT